MDERDNVNRNDMPIILLVIIIPSTTSSAASDDSKIVIYDEKLSDKFFITSSPPINVQSTKVPNGNGNHSIEFVNSFYIFSKNDPIKNLTFDRTTHRFLSFDVMTTSPDQDITVTLISTTKEGYSLPLIDPVHPSNSFSKSTFLTQNKWTNIKLDLEYFPFNSFRGVWFLQKHPNTSIFIDNIILEPQLIQRNYGIIYHSGMIGYGILIRDNDQTKLFQNDVVFKGSENSIEMDISKNSTLLFQYTSFLRPKNMSLSFLINWGSLGNGGKKIIETTEQAEKKKKDKKDNDKKDKEKDKDKKKKSNDDDKKKKDKKDNDKKDKDKNDKDKKDKDKDNNHNNIFENPTTNNTTNNDKDSDDKDKDKDDDDDDKLIIDSITLSFIPSLQIEQTKKFTFNRNKQKGWNRMTVKIPESTFSGFSFSVPSNLTEKYNVYFDDVRIEILVQPQNLSFGKYQTIEDKRNQVLYQLDNQTTTTSPNSTEKEITSSFPGSRYFPFTKLSLDYVTSTNGVVSKWVEGFPTITLKTTQTRVVGRGDFVSFENEQLQSLVGPGPLEVLFQKETEMNDFQFLHLDFSFPTNQFYLVVGAVDNFEDIWISATDQKFATVMKWNLLASGFLNPLGNETDSMIKYKVKNQALYLTAGKGDNSLPLGTHRNYIVVQPVDKVSTLSFSMVSSVDSSLVFYSLYAISPNTTNSINATSINPIPLNNINSTIISK
ncbi:hypothetical protein DFA_01133 [Cavenderia fasciculata]|uniref:Uncharacterized protein n=1 Tax=Cavenderia fasciculata TaxID=261658 RepID=F4PQZ0_CACFS|nr:uncharacterized protein DFA_01133 [Cavenderia fasciculata]EGG21255.1 hypothetical protein DFA_01133 [Cavenderia fasciculata]|eukprot:XP_004359105.1 hypothetical protein DFA_01133 [Cavenderia fasciculata]